MYQGQFGEVVSTLNGDMLTLLPHVGKESDEFIPRVTEVEKQAPSSGPLQGH